MVNCSMFQPKKLNHDTVLRRLVAATGLRRTTCHNTALVVLRNPVVVVPCRPRPNCHERNQRHFRRRSHWLCRRYEASKSVRNQRISECNMQNGSKCCMNSNLLTMWQTLTNSIHHNIPTYLFYPKPLTCFAVEGYVLVKACNHRAMLSVQRWIARIALWGKDSWSRDPRTRFENLANVWTCLKIFAPPTLNTQKY